MDLDDTSRRRTMAIIGVVAVVVAVLALYLIFGSSGSSGNASSSASPTAEQTGEGSSGSTADTTPSESSAPDTSPESTAAPLPATDPAVADTLAPDPTLPRSARQFDDLDTPTVSYARGPDPAAGCTAATGDVARFEFDGSVISPRCLRVQPGQVVEVTNRWSGEAAVYVATTFETVAPGDSARYGPAGTLADGAGTFDVWVSGFPDATSTIAIG